MPVAIRADGQYICKGGALAAIVCWDRSVNAWQGEVLIRNDKWTPGMWDKDGKFLTGGYAYDLWEIWNGPYEGSVDTEGEKPSV